ncbi:MAG: hypothetical protein FJ190_10240 [Gammaproteobacteria bacterium]|nr:hypothetical protein [Gammaproteobacteria bacterium]
MVIKLILCLCFLALAGFFLAIVTGQFLLTGLAEHIVQLSSLLLLSAFGLLLLAALISIGRVLLTSILNYCTGKNRIERRLFYYINNYHRLNRLFQLKKDRLAYQHQQQLKRLLRQSH